MPSQNGRIPLAWRLAWRLENGIKSATDGALDAAVSVCERSALYSGALVVLGLVGEVGFAALHLPNGCFWEHWGPVFADILVAVGVLGEVLFSARANTCQGELAQRSKDRLADANRNVAALQKQLAPRFIGPEFSQALHGQPTAHVRIEYLRDAPDTLELSGWIVSRLVPAGWIVDDFSSIKSASEGPLSTLPTIFSAGGELTGVTIIPSFDVPGIAGGSDGQVSMFNRSFEGDKRVKEIGTTSAALEALTEAFLASLGMVAVGRPDMSLPAGSFRIVVGPKA